MLAVSLAKVELSNREKILLVVLIFLICLSIFLLGVIYSAIKKGLISASKDIDKEVVAYHNHRLAKDEAHFKHLARSKNQIMFFKEATIPVILLGGSVLLLFIFSKVNSLKWTYIFDYIYDALLKLDFPTTKLFGLTVISDWPTLNSASFIFHNDAKAIIAYIFSVLFIIGAIWFIVVIARYGARNRRIYALSKKLYREVLAEATPAQQANNSKD